MKIIGQNKGGFIISASRAEVANLIGYYSQFTKHMPDVGAEIAVHPMYSQLYKIAAMQNRIDSVRDTLATMLKDLETVVPVIDCATEGMAEAPKE